MHRQLEISFLTRQNFRLHRIQNSRFFSQTQLFFRFDFQIFCRSFFGDKILPRYCRVMDFRRISERLQILDQLIFTGLIFRLTFAFYIDCIFSGFSLTDRPGVAVFLPQTPKFRRPTSDYPQIFPFFAPIFVVLDLLPRFCGFVTPQMLFSRWFLDLSCRFNFESSQMILFNTEDSDFVHEFLPFTLVCTTLWRQLQCFSLSEMPDEDPRWDFLSDFLKTVWLGRFAFLLVKGRNFDKVWLRYRGPPQSRIFP